MIGDDISRNPVFRKKPGFWCCLALQGIDGIAGKLTFQQYGVYLSMLSVYLREGYMLISITEAHNRLSHWLEKVPDRAITITRRGKPVGVLVSPEEYERLRQVQAYLEMLRLAGSLQDRGVTASELARASREELEARP
jgi:prevent-host-death family protein